MVFPSVPTGRAQQSGYLYILGNPSFKRRYLKIGLTTVDPKVRANDLSSSTSIPMDFVLEHAVAVSDVITAERRAHLLLDDHRVNPGKEFFCLRLNHAIKTCDAIAGFEHEDLTICNEVMLHEKLSCARYVPKFKHNDYLLLYNLMGATFNKTFFDHLARSRVGIVDGFLDTRSVMAAFGVTSAAANDRMRNIASRSANAVCHPLFHDPVGKVFEFIRYYRGHLAWRFTNEYRELFWNKKT